jgi:hypothetical protein
MFERGFLEEKGTKKLESERIQQRINDFKSHLSIDLADRLG